MLSINSKDFENFWSTMKKHHKCITSLRIKANEELSEEKAQLFFNTAIRKLPKLKRNDMPHQFCIVQHHEGTCLDKNYFHLPKFFHFDFMRRVCYIISVLDSEADCKIWQAVFKKYSWLADFTIQEQKWSPAFVPSTKTE